MHVGIHKVPYVLRNPASTRCQMFTCITGVLNKTRGIFSPALGGEIKFRWFFPPQDLRVWGGKTKFLPPQDPDPWGGKTLLFPTRWGGKSSPQAKIFSILTSRMLDFLCGNAFQKCNVPHESLKNFACGGLF